MLEDTTENTGDYLRLDGSGLSKEDAVNAEIYTTRQFPDNDSSIILEDTSDFERPNFLVNEEIGNQLVMNAFSTETDIFTNNTVGDGDRILLHDQKPVEESSEIFDLNRRNPCFFKKACPCPFNRADSDMSSLTPFLITNIVLHRENKICLVPAAPVLFSNRTPSHLVSWQ